jgi:hypothetical protein
VDVLERHPNTIEPFGWIDYRIGLQGNKVNFNNDFDAITVKLGVQGNLTDKIFTRITIKDASHYVPLSVLGVETGEGPSFLDTPGNRLHGYGGDDIWLDEAFVNIKANGADWTLGRQFQSYGMGLMVNNERLSQQGVRFRKKGVFSKNLNLDAAYFAGSLNHLPIEPYYQSKDGYVSARFEYQQPRWTVALNTLPDGAGDENAAGTDLWVNLGHDRNLYAEYSREWHHVNRFAFAGHAPVTAVAVSADLIKTPTVALTGFYSHVDAEYDIIYSSLHPYYEQIENTTADANHIPWERWLRNPITMTNIQAYGATVSTHVGEFPFEFCYYKLSAISDWWWESQLQGLDFDRLWAATFHKALAHGAGMSLTYGEELPSGHSPVFRDPDKLLQTQFTVGF